MKFNTKMKFQQQKILLDDQELFNNSEFLHCLGRKKKGACLLVALLIIKKKVAKHRYLASQK